jgi:gluconolactonase
MNPSLTIYNDSILDFINADFEIEKVAGDCVFTEGPVWNEEGFYLFSDIPTNCIYKITPGENKEVYLKNSGTNNPKDPDLKEDQAGSNALAYDDAGNLLICQHGSHGIARFDGKSIQPFINSYDGKPFNSPNDLILHSDGRIYFSDPPYGLKDGKPNVEKYQPLAGVYCWKNGKLELISDKFQYPNGVCLSPPEDILYICSNKPFEKFIATYDTASHNFIKIFAEENSDGIECDSVGNIYLCNKDGIIILDTDGNRLALIKLETIPANCCWGEDGDLFITARENIFLIRGLRSISTF